MEFNPYDYDFHCDPYPTYAWLREEAPAYHNTELDFWALSRFDDVLAGLHNPATYTSSKGVALEDEGPEGAAGSMIHMDPPDHTKMRKFIAQRFTPRRIAELEPLIRTWAKSLVAGLDGRDHLDVVDEFGARLPTTVISTMLGIPVESHDDVRHWTDAYLHREPGVRNLPPESNAAANKLVAMSAQLMTLRRERPTEDLLSLIVTVEIDGQPLNDAQVIGFCLLLIAGGHETTAKLIANGVRLFGSHPEQRAAVIEDPELMTQAVEELLRFTSPTQFMTRTTTREVELHGKTIPADAAGCAPARFGKSRPARVRASRRLRHLPQQPTHPRVRPRRTRVPRCCGGPPRSPHRAPGVPCPLPRIRGRRGRHRVHALRERARSLQGAHRSRVTKAERAPVSAARLAEQLGDRLPSAASVPESAFELVARVRELVEAVVMTDVSADARASAADQIAAVTTALRTRRRPEALFLVRHPDGRLESLVQAGSGRLNPQAPPVEWTHRPTEPPVGERSGAGRGDRSVHVHRRPRRFAEPRVRRRPRVGARRGDRRGHRGRGRAGHDRRAQRVAEGRHAVRAAGRPRRSPRRAGRDASGLRPVRYWSTGS